MPSSLNQFGTNIVEDESQRERGFCRKIWKKTRPQRGEYPLLFSCMGVTDSVGDLSEPYIFPDNEDLQNIEIRSMAEF